MNRYDILKKNARKIVWSKPIVPKAQRRNKMANVQVLVIDGQNDFCDPKGALFVKGANEDMARLAKMIREKKHKIDDIRVTLDSHRYLHIAHPIWWQDKDGNAPNPFTLITVADVSGSNPKWKAKNPGFQKRSVEYVTKLSNTPYPLCIWPQHCLIGGWGHGVYPVLFEAIQEWEKGFAVADFVTKGSNMFTEHYSAVKAEVTDPEDPTTLINTDFIKRLQTADIIAISGEALSHCVASTVSDIANEFGPDQVKKFVLLEDACSPVTGFENLAETFVKDMVSRGMQISNTKDFLA